MEWSPQPTRQTQDVCSHSVEPSARMWALVLTLCFGVSNAWLYQRNDIIVNATQSVQNECLGHGAAGRCDFYDCFEHRLPCGGSGYINSFGGYYCRRFNERFDAFNDQGKSWIQRTMRCLSERLLIKYNQDAINCHSLSHEAWDTWGECYDQTGFCDVFWGNRGAFYDVYQFRDLFRPGATKIWREMFQIMGRCATVRASRAYNNSGGFSGIVDSIRNIGERIRESVHKK